MKTNFNLILVIAIYLSITFLCIGCEEEEPGNLPPVITSISINPSTTTPGTNVQVTSIVTDMDGDKIQYTWRPDFGSVTDLNNQSTTWNIPISAAVDEYYNISLTVTDGKSIIEKNKSIKIIVGGTVKGYIYYHDTKIPISNVNISIGNLTTHSDDEGFYELINAPFGNNTIIVSKDGFDEISIDSDISNTNMVDFYMTSSEYTKKLYGYVQTVDGIYLENARVTLLNPDDSDSDISTVSDINGFYQLVKLPTGEQTIKIKDESASYIGQTSEYDIYVGSSDLNYSPRMFIRRIVQLDILNINNLEITDDCYIDNNKLVIMPNGRIYFTMPETIPSDILPAISNSSGDFIYINILGNLSGSDGEMYIYFDDYYYGKYYSISSYIGEKGFKCSIASKGKKLKLGWNIGSSDDYWEITEVNLEYYW